MLQTGNSGTNADDLKRAAAEAESAAKVNLGNVIPGLDAIIAKLTTAQSTIGGLATEIKSSIEATESQVNSVSRLFAGSHQLAQQTRNLYRDVTPSVAALGGSITDVSKIQKGVLEGLQTQSSLNSDSYKELYAAGSLVAGASENAGAKAAAMIPMFANAGYGINNIGNEMTGILNSAKELGVTSQSVYKQLEGQMGKMALYNFDGGVQGMAKMAAQASLLRIDMGKTLGLADKLFEPDAAVQMSAAFQRLGVQVSSLLDPYKLMDMSRNDPAKLQEEVGKALKSMTYFDEQTKSIRILPGAQGQLREIAKELSMSNEEVAKWAMNAGDLDRKMREITFNPEFADEDSKKMIAGMAQLGEKGGKFEGQYIIKTATGDEKLVSEISKPDLDEIKATNEKLASPAKMQLEANGILKNIEGLIAARKGVVGQAIASDPGTVKNINSMAKVIATGQETLNRTIGLQRDANDQNQINVKSISTNINKLTTVISDAFGKAAKGDMTGAEQTLLEGGKTALDDLKKAGANIPNNLSGANQMWGGNIDLNSLSNMIQTAQSNLPSDAKKEFDNLLDMFGIDASKLSQTVNSSQIQNASPTPTITPNATITPSQITNPTINNGNTTPPLPETGNVKVDGTISVNVNPIGLESFVMDMLAKSDVSTAIYQGNSRTERMMNDLKGSGENKAKAGNLFGPTSAFA
jgi:hypothetical protein